MLIQMTGKSLVCQCCKKSQIVRQMERVDVNGLPFGVIDSGNYVECGTHIFSHVSLNVFYLRIHSFDGWEESFGFLLEIV